MASTGTHTRARHLRRDSTDAERALLLRSYGEIESQEVRTKLRELMRSLSGTKKRRGGGRRPASLAEQGEELAGAEAAAS
jgi:hypothetical protein